MQKHIADINGVPSLILKSPYGPGVVVITDSKRVGVPETIEKGAYFSVYPFGRECGVVISHAPFNRRAVQHVGVPIPNATTVDQSDDELLMRAAQHYLAEAEIACAEFDPRLDDAANSRQPIGIDNARSAERLAAAQEFNRMVGVRLHHRMTSAEAKHKQKVLANIKRKAAITEKNRRSREKKLVKAITQFRKIPGGPSYLHYLKLQVRGEGDIFSMMDDENITQRSGPKHVIEVRRWLGDAVEIAAALRWILRGLSPNMAIRKVIVDKQEQDLAGCALQSVPAKIYTYRRVR